MGLPKLLKKSFKFMKSIIMSHMPCITDTPKAFYLTAALGALLFTSCDRTRIQKGYEYFPDMAHSLAYETYAPAPVMKNGMTMQMPVEGTVPWEMIPYQYPATPEGRLQAGKDLKCTILLDKATLARGKEMFSIFCQDCHGKKGDGAGHLFTSGKFPIPPASLVNDRMKAAPIGEIYHVITRGWNTMGAHGPQVEPEDRWKIALYIKNVLQK
jgi:mono/diheme cytochrome c family protein